jgi:hypothetical protein
VNTPGETESSGVPSCEIPHQLSALEPWREVGRLEGLCVVKGDPIPWVVQVVGKRVGGLELLLE